MSQKVTVVTQWAAGEGPGGQKPIGWMGQAREGELPFFRVEVDVTLGEMREIMWASTRGFFGVVDRHTGAEFLLSPAAGLIRLREIEVDE